MSSFVLLPYEFLLEQNAKAIYSRCFTVLLPYEFLLEQNHIVDNYGVSKALLP